MTPSYQFPDGRKFFGKCQGGSPHGKGKMVFPDGTIKKGRFKNGSLEGKGEARLPDGIIQKGRFKNGNLEGKGKEIVGEFTYLGNFKNGIFQEGIVTLIFHGCAYKGAYLANTFHRHFSA